MLRATARIVPITAVKKMINPTNHIILLIVTGEDRGSNDEFVEEA